MIFSKIYTQKTKLFLRLMALIAVIILVIANTYIILQKEKISFILKDLVSFITLIYNSIVCICFIVVVLFPTKINFLSIASFLYSVIILVFEPTNPMGIFMYFLCITSLMARGFFLKHKKAKIIISTSLLLLLCFSEIRFGKEFFLTAVVDKFAYTFIVIITLFFFNAYITDSLENNNSDKKLDIKQFSDLRRRDAEWLVEILNGKKYETLAIDYNMSLGSVKNRMRIIFDVLEVGDKQGFFNKYSNYEICYGDEFTSNEKHK